MEIEEIAKIVVAAVILVIVGAAVIFLFKGKGGDILAGLNKMIHLGRA